MKQNKVNELKTQEDEETIKNIDNSMVKTVIYAVGASRKVGRTYTELVIRVGVTSIEKDKEKCGRVGQPLLGCQ